MERGVNDSYTPPDEPRVLSEKIIDGLIEALRGRITDGHEVSPAEINPDRIGAYASKMLAGKIEDRGMQARARETRALMADKQEHLADIPGAYLTL